MRVRWVVTALLLAAWVSGCTESPQSAGRAKEPPTDTTSDETQVLSADSCTQNCSGNDAGYDWAEKKGIIDPNDCTGGSDSFVEGCMAYAEEQRQDRDRETHEE